MNNPQNVTENDQIAGYYAPTVGLGVKSVCGAGPSWPLLYRLYVVTAGQARDGEKPGCFCRNPCALQKETGDFGDFGNPADEGWGVGRPESKG
jgi:hypothetical protein